MKQMVNPWNIYVKLSAVVMGSHGLPKGSLAFPNCPAQLMFKSTKNWLSMDSSMNQEKRNFTSRRAAKLKEKVYNPCTPEQNQALEGFYCRNPHPDASDREQIGAAVGLSGYRIKYWFQNRRSRDKRKSNKSLNEKFKEEIDVIRIANETSKLTLRTAMCNSGCMEHSKGDSSSSDIERLKLENACMKDMIDKMNKQLEKSCGISMKYSPDPVDNYPVVNQLPAEGPSNQDISVTEPQFEELDLDLIFDYNEEAHQSLDL